MKLSDKRDNRTFPRRPGRRQNGGKPGGSMQ